MSKLSELIPELHILGMDIEVRYPVELITVKEGEEEIKCVGLARIDENVIEVCDSPTLKYEAKLRTLLHEVLETIAANLELGLKHKQISSLETALFQVLRNNPNFAKAFTLYIGKK